MVRFVSAVLAISAITLGFACSSSSTDSPPAATPKDDAGSGNPDPTNPEDVPKVKLEASTDDCASGYKSKAPKAGTINVGYDVAGQKRSFYLQYPDDSDDPQPVFIAFNGTGENGKEFFDRAELQSFVKRGFIVIAPDSIGNGDVWPIWDSIRPTGKENDENKDIEFTESLLKCVAAYRSVDKNRIYGGGHSAGGIFTNNIIQRKSDIFAGAIVASGIFSQTSPKPADDMDKMLVLVTWGGSNDNYTGRAGTATVTKFDFVPEASNASKYYAAQRNVGQANCHGKNYGHAWLGDLNDWFVDVMLAHPKGLPGAGNLELPDTPAKAGSKCTTDVFEYKSAGLTCGSSTKEGCQQACQLFASCGYTNTTVSSVLGPQFKEIGFAPNDCSGCITHCESKVTDSAEDQAVMTCLKGRDASTCGAGIQGALPLVNAINDCCVGKTNSAYCKDTCGIIKENATALGYFETCKSF